MRQATADDWEISPLPLQHKVLQLDILLTEEQSQAVKRGFIPEAMEQKWFGYFKDNILYQHRSWTGFCIDEIQFVEQGNCLRAVSVKVNRDWEQYKNLDDAEDIERVTSMLDWVYNQDEI